MRSLPEESKGINLDFSTNDYLNFSNKTELKIAAQIALQETMIGATGSRLLSGNHKYFEILEAQIAKDKHMEKALYFTTGFQANFSCLEALLDLKVLKSRPLVFFDKRNHNSLYQAVLKDHVELVRYSSLEQLQELLQQYAQDISPKFLVTETVFGMDGDVIDIFFIKKLAIEHNLFIFFDEAHATGIIGPDGLGLSRNVNWESVSVVIMGTFSKALGCMGAYVASKEIVIDYLMNKAAGFIYSTASSPPIVAACLEAWLLNQKQNDARQHLLNLSSYLRKQLRIAQYPVALDPTPIIPVIVGDEKKALDLKAHLAQRGILVSAIRHPTVPLNKARIRIALKASHTQANIDTLLEALL